MILTSHSNDDFQEWYTDKYSEYNICYVDEIHLYAMIIEWLDSVGIYITIQTSKLFNKRCYFWTIESIKSCITSYTILYDSRIDSTMEAIIVADTIYNKNANIRSAKT